MISKIQVRASKTGWLVGWFGLFCFFVSLNALKLAQMARPSWMGYAPFSSLPISATCRSQKLHLRVVDFGCLTVEFVTKWSLNYVPLNATKLSFNVSYFFGGAPFGGGLLPSSTYDCGWWILRGNSKKYAPKVLGFVYMIFLRIVPC